MHRIDISPGHGGQRGRGRGRERRRGSQIREQGRKQNKTKRKIQLIIMVMVIIVFIAKATEARGERPGWSQRKGLESFKLGGAHDQSFQKLLWLLYIESIRDSLEAESPSTEEE